METAALKFIDFISSQINYERAWLRKIHFMYSHPFSENSVTRFFENWEVSYRGTRKTVIRNTETFDEVSFRYGIGKKLFFSINNEPHAVPQTVEEFISLAQSHKIQLKWKPEVKETFKPADELPARPAIPLYR